MTAHVRRVPHPTVLAFPVLAILSVVYFVLLGRHATFHHDEWVFMIERTSLSLDTLLRPHNEHLSVGLVVVYRGLLELFGMSTYLPYLAVVLALHVVAAAAVFVSGSAKAGRWIGLALATVFLFLGAAWENLLWGFQIGFLASTAAGAWALVALDAPVSRSRGAVVCLLLVVSIGFSGMGLVFLAAAMAMGLYERRTALRWIAVPAVLYAVWFATYGWAAVASHGDRLTPQSLDLLPAWIVASGSVTVGRVLGIQPPLGGSIGMIGIFAVSALIVARTYRGVRVPGLVLACAAGVAAQLVLTGLVRFQFGHEFGAASRYLSSIGILMLLGTGAVLAQSPDRRLRIDRTVMACWVVAILIVTSNIAESMVGRSYFWLRAAETRTLISLVQQYIEAPSVDPDGRVEPYPTPRQILAAVARYGSPLRDRLVPDPPPRPSVEVTERMLFRLIEPTLAIQVSTPPPSGTQGALVTTGSSASGLKAAGGTEVRFMAPYDGEVRAYLARSASFGREKSIAVQATALAWYALVIPDLGDGESWRIRFEAEDRSWTVVAAVMET